MWHIWRLMTHVTIHRTQTKWYLSSDVQRRIERIREMFHCFVRQDRFQEVDADRETSVPDSLTSSHFTCCVGLLNRIPWVLPQVPMDFRLNSVPVVLFVDSRSLTALEGVLHRKIDLGWSKIIMESVFSACRQIICRRSLFCSVYYMV